MSADLAQVARGRRLLVLLAALLFLGLGALAAADPPALSGPHPSGAQNRVGAFTPAAQLLVGGRTAGLPSSRPDQSGPAAGIVVGCCGATEEGAGATRALAPIAGGAASAEEALTSPALLEGLTPEQVDSLAREAGYDIAPGKPSAANPATRYYVPGTKQSEGVYVLPEGVAGQTGIKGGPYLKFFGGDNNGTRVPLAGNPGP